MKNWKNMMAILIIVTLFYVFASSVYVIAGRVTGVEYDNDLVFIEDRRGDVWVFSGMEDEVICGDEIGMLMWNRFTPLYEDDVVLKIG